MSNVLIECKQRFREHMNQFIYTADVETGMRFLDTYIENIVRIRNEIEQRNIDEAYTAFVEAQAKRREGRKNENT